ncbi:MAG: flagellar motor protein MotA [Rhodospirillales bacterium]|nr:flagellar motor protein MotA [Rhodospirillales bacterium]
MTRPQRYLIRMIVFLIAVLLLTAILFRPLAVAFMTNPPLNGFILGVFLLGILYNFRQVAMLYPEVGWIENFRQRRGIISQRRPPKLLSPMATMLGERQDRLSLSATSMRSLLDGISSRLDESRDMSRYMIGLLIFLGLLGTFWGLMQTVSSIREVIGGLTMGGGDVAMIFQNMKRGLELPLGGMGTAFTSSLFGLGGSLVLGFLDLQAGQAQNRFFNDLEEWLSSLTRLSSGSLSGDGDQTVPAYVQALLEQTADSLENLQRTIIKGEENHIEVNNSLRGLGEKLGILTDHMRTEQTVMRSLAETQVELKPVLVQIADMRLPNAQQSGMDETTRAHIRNLDMQLARLVEELRAGRQDLVQNMRSEIKLLARTMAALAESAER